MGKLVPIQWASKKLTQTETRYTISEKETLAILFGVEKFSYELRGRKFHLITDHKALERIRSKPEFNNNRINRWIEKIQDFDFTIEYQKGNQLIGADALSRIYEVEASKKNLKKKINKIKGAQIIQGKEKYHVIENDGKAYWRFDSGIMKEIPKKDERKHMIQEIHKDMLHRGLETVYHELKKNIIGWV